MARQELRLVKERRLADLVAPPKGSDVLEASGVVSKGGDFYVIFDNVRHVARIDPGLSPTSKRHEWFGRRRPGDGYEDIAYSPARNRFYLLIEAEKHADGSYKPLIDECDEAGHARGAAGHVSKRNTGSRLCMSWKGAEYLLSGCARECIAGLPARRDRKGAADASTC
jgi:hypothetical protein